MRGWTQTFVLAVDVLWLSSSLGSAQQLSDAQIDIIVQNLAVGATHSWEFGTRSQSLIELNSHAFNVLNTSFKLPPSHSAPSSLFDVLHIADETILNRTAEVANASEFPAPQPFFPGDTSTADPSSMGVAILIANWTGMGNSSVDYAGAAQSEIEFLFSDAVRKTSDGAFSHRTDQLQLWSDFTYMVPPFLAYYGVMNANSSMVEEAYTQIKLYRNYLRDTNASNLWRHVVMGNGTDPGHWSTGNAWAAAGMLRVLGTIKNSQFAKSMKNEQTDLTNWVKEIHNAMYSHIRSDNLFYNYADDNSTFADASSAALLAATVYRMSLLTNTHTHLPQAEKVRKTLSSPSTSSGSGSGTNPNSLAGMLHFTSDGWLTPVVDPLSVGVSGQKSPEGQAFVVQMHAAWQDWVAQGSKGANAARRTASDLPSTSVVALWSAFVASLSGGLWGGRAHTPPVKERD
ncbi:hypothetical protein SCHPADRAFT_833725 [Schizopora paradoxa]|uniref:Six-hairpin glycosidase n=1 Tax=Schizopora paradoxa TaxID=27342 RepID=A0A0H2RY24_9AGAM|nr:hypothetical protein SCHPADRAFT_833725 [Schizopora paradoxa]